jgi:replication initiation protein RepC
VLEACPDVKEHTASGDIRNWPDFITTLRAIRPMLGVSPDAWEAAVVGLGERQAAVALATILQRSEHSSEARHASGLSTVNGSPAIRSPGGYLRALTKKAGAGAFTLGPVLMALMGQRLKAKRAGV